MSSIDFWKKVILQIWSHTRFCTDNDDMSLLRVYLVHLSCGKWLQSRRRPLMEPLTWGARVDERASYNEMKWKCGDLKCVQKPTRGRLSLTHLKGVYRCKRATCKRKSPMQVKGLWRWRDPQRRTLSMVMVKKSPLANLSPALHRYVRSTRCRTSYSCCVISCSHG